MSGLGGPVRSQDHPALLNRSIAAVHNAACCSPCPGAAGSTMQGGSAGGHWRACSAAAPITVSKLLQVESKQLCALAATPPVVRMSDSVPTRPVVHSCTSQPEAISTCSA
jgi:hypothetical protein